jgi:hypothetical protein
MAKRPIKRPEIADPGVPAADLVIVYRDPRELKSNPRNARVHSPGQIAELRTVMRRWGWTNPALIDEADGIIAGHGRVEAAIAEGIARGPTIVLLGLSDTEKRALSLADNKLALNSSWDDNLLRAEIADLQAAGGDLGLIGFSMEELREIVFPLPPKERGGEPGLGDGLSYQVIVECDDEAQQAEILEDLRDRGITCKPLIL